MQGKSDELLDEPESSRQDGRRRTTVCIRARQTTIVCPEHGNNVHRLIWDCRGSPHQRACKARWQNNSQQTRTACASGDDQWIPHVTDLLCMFQSHHPSYATKAGQRSVEESVQQRHFNLCQSRTQSLQSRSCSSKPGRASRGLHCDSRGNYAIDWKTSSLLWQHQWEMHWPTSYTHRYSSTGCRAGHRSHAHGNTLVGKSFLFVCGWSRCQLLRT